ncbi:polymorphic toxin-type HINT domain-containing protein [Streptomyces sp. NPDC056352]|uniref:polymorphic toxin-type HINT domain-containing protein n=1 Tax=Streptomyces sp. NPDC056352 TaxID=3345791 RepID=UPI0035DE0E9F
MRTTAPDGGKVTYLMADTQASTQLAVDAKTGTTTRRRYTPFGDDRSGNLPAGTDHGFLGKTEDTATGLSLLGARAYDPKLGRFLSPDPLNTPYDPQNLSAYSYTHNDPINYSDPTGLCEDDGTGHCAPARKPKPKSKGNDEGDIARERDKARDAQQAVETAVRQALSNAGEDAWVNAYNQDIQKIYKSRGAAAVDANTVLATAVNVCWVHEELACPKGLKNYFMDVELGRMGQVGLYEDAAGRTIQDIVHANTDLGRALRSSPCNSFLPDAKIRTADGVVKPIEDIKVGDKVLATDPETGKTESRTVLATIITKGDKDFTELTVRTAKGDASVIATDHHPFWSPSEHAWMDAGDVKPHMTLRAESGMELAVTAVRSFRKQQETRNLTVDGIHTYYVLAGATPVLVHNSSCTTVPNLNGKTLEEARAEIERGGFVFHSESKSGYIRYRHNDGGEVYIRPDGEVMRLGPKVRPASGEGKSYHPRLDPEGNVTQQHDPKTEMIRR